MCKPRSFTSASVKYGVMSESWSLFEMFLFYIEQMCCVWRVGVCRVWDPLCNAYCVSLQIICNRLSFSCR